MKILHRIRYNLTIFGDKSCGIFQKDLVWNSYQQSKETALTQCEPTDSHLPWLTSFLQSSRKRQNRSGVFMLRSHAGEFILWVAWRMLAVRQLAKGLKRDGLQNCERGHYQSKHKSEAKG